MSTVCPKESRVTKDKVLIVDDDPAVLLSIEALISDHCAVTLAPSIAAAHAALQNDAFDVVVTDFDLPDASGIDLINSMRAEYPCTVGILLTGHSHHPEILKIQPDGLRYRVVHKPFKPESFFARIQQCIKIAKLQQSRSRLKSERGT
jgi:two-component system response regulator HydG